MKLPINPPGPSLGTENAILSGYGTRYHVPDFEGCLSLKSVVQGSADWETDGRRFVVNHDCYLILNDRQHYTLTIDSPTRVKTFCLFFERGFVEEINRVMIRAARVCSTSDYARGSLWHGRSLPKTSSSWQPGWRQRMWPAPVLW